MAIRKMLCSNSSISHRSIHQNPSNKKPTKYFPSLLPYCRKIQDLKAFKCQLIIHGLITSQSLIKQVIDQIFHLGFVELALSTFNVDENPSLSLQNLMVRSLCDNGYFDDVLVVYQKCRVSGCLSDNYTYPFVIKACSVLSDAYFGKKLHSLVLRSGYGENVVVQTGLIDFYSRIGEVRTAREVIDRIPQPDLVAWNALLAGYAFNGVNRGVFEVFQAICKKDLRPNVSTLASAIPICSRCGAFYSGRSLHAYAYKCGYTNDESLVPALISMYANCGDILAAKSIFHSLAVKNVNIWNAMISAFTRNHKSDEAIMSFKRMLVFDSVTPPNMVTFVSVIPSCENCSDIGLVESFHGHVIKFGFEVQVSVVTALLSVYGIHRNVDAAEFLFNNASQKNLLSWNSIISVYVNNNQLDASLHAFHAMQMTGLVPDTISIINILSVCSKLEATLSGKSVHAFSLKRKIDLNLNTSNALLAFYCDRGELDYSCKIFNKMVAKNVVTWNTMISGFVDNKETERAILLFNEMIQEGVDFDLVTLISILPSCEKLISGAIIHGYAVKTAMVSDISLVNALISMYINCGELDSGSSLFEEMPNKSVISWNALMTGHRYLNSPNKIVVLFDQMIEEGYKPNYVTFLNVLPSCSTLLQVKSIHGYFFRTEMPLETVLVTSLIISYAKFGNLCSSMILFHMGDKENISLWNAIMSAHLHLTKGMMVFSLFLELIQRQMEPDEVTVLHLISACLQLKNLNITNSLLAYLIQTGFDKDVVITNALIDLNAKCGNISSARNLFEGLAEKDIISWGVMINAYGLNGDGKEALALFMKMRVVGVKPDRTTYLTVLSACSHSSLVEEGRMVFNSMIHDGLPPGTEHYACMVDLLGRNGYLNEAWELVKNLPHKDSMDLLGSVLGACLSHGNYALGEEIGKLVLERKPEDSRPYVILHNIYASAGKWLDADRVRLEMDKKQLMKAPGFSFIGETP